MRANEATNQNCANTVEISVKRGLILCILTLYWGKISIFPICQKNLRWTEKKKNPPHTHLVCPFAGKKKKGRGCVSAFLFLPGSACVLFFPSADCAREMAGFFTKWQNEYANCERTKQPIKIAHIPLKSE